VGEFSPAIAENSACVRKRLCASQVGASTAQTLRETLREPRAAAASGTRHPATAGAAARRIDVDAEDGPGHHRSRASWAAELTPSSASVAGPETKRPRVPAPGRFLQAGSLCAPNVLHVSALLQQPGRPHQRGPPVTDYRYAAEVEVLANERFAAVGNAVLAALADSGLSARRAANVLSWFVVAQLALGPWRSRGEVRPAELARRMGVSRWTEWRARRDAAVAGLVRDWTLPDPEARGYGRGAVRVLDLAFVRTRAVTQKVAAAKEERATRAERRREARRRAKEHLAPTAAPSVVRCDLLAPAPLTGDDFISPVAGRLRELLRRVQPAALPDGEAACRAGSPPT
jgi:hypothetical protein